MNHPERITASFHNAGRRLTASGWITVYTIVLLMIGALIYFGGKRP